MDRGSGDSRIQLSALWADRVHALEEISRISSRRAYQRLRMFDDCLAVHQTANVAELRHDIQIACAAS
jgi:hypothetical protein